MGKFEQELKKGIDKRDVPLEEVEKVLGRRYLEAFRMVERDMEKLYSTLGPEMTLSQARQSGRLTKLLKELKANYTKVTKQSITSTIENSIDAYNASYLNFSNAAESVGTTIAAVNKTAVLKSVMNSKSSYNLIKTFNKNIKIELARINGSITRGIATGEGYAKTAEKLKGAFNGGFSDAVRVVRTEEARVWTEAHLSAYDEAKKAGLNVANFWLSTDDDGRNREWHLDIDGQQADENGMFHLVSGPNQGAEALGPGLFGIPEEDIACRCALDTRLLD